MTWPYPRFVAHRGAGVLAPENTLLALETGWQHGYRAAEVDAALTADAVPVLLHDATLDRTTSGSGSLAAIEAAALAQLDAGSWLDARFSAARVPTLQAALQCCRERGIWLNVEIKPVPRFEERTGAVVARTVADFCTPPGGAAGAGETSGIQWPVLSSFSRVALAAARDAAPQLRRGMLFSRIPADWHEVLVSLDAFSLHCDHRHLDARLARAVTDAGYGLLCYTVNDPERARRLLDWGVDAICTDRIDLIPPAAAAAP
jgi:glycerophosphoryl diester phosphodiesterase